MALVRRPLGRLRVVLFFLAFAVVPRQCTASPVGPRRNLGAALKFAPSLVDNVRLALPTSVAQEAEATPDDSTNSTTTSFENIVSVVPFPSEQPPQTRQQIMSFLLFNSSFTNAINNATIDCLTVGTGTRASAWGLWAFKRFTSDMTQLEYFCNVPDEIADGQFAKFLKDYVDPRQVNSGLTNCVLRKDVGLGFGKFYIGRETEERNDLEHDSTKDGGGSPAWIPGLVIGLIGCICLIGALALAKVAGGRKYQPSEFDEMEQDEVPVKVVSTDDELRMMADGT